MKLIGRTFTAILTCVAIGCSIHIGNPKDFDGKSQKAKPEVQVNLVSAPLEQGEQVALSFTSVAIIDERGKRTLLSEESGSSIVINAAGDWNSIVTSSGLLSQQTMYRLSLVSNH